MAIVNELVTSLGFKIDQASMAALKGMKGAIKEVVGAIDQLGETNVFKNLKQQLEQVATEYRDIAKKSGFTGLSTEAIQRWRHAADVAGENADAIISDVAKLFHEGGQPGLIDAMNEIYSMNEYEAKKYAESRGLSSSFVSLIKNQGGTAGVMKLLEESNLLDSENIKNAKEFAEEKGRLQSFAKTMKDRFLSMLMDPVTEVMKETNKKLKEKDFYQKELDPIADRVGKGLSYAFRTIRETAEGIIEMEIPNYTEWKDKNGNSDWLSTATGIMTIGALLGVAKTMIKKFIYGPFIKPWMGLAKFSAGPMAIASGANMIWTEAKNAFKEQGEDRDLNWFEQFSNESGLTKFIADRLSPEMKTAIRKDMGVQWQINLNQTFTGQASPELVSKAAETGIVKGIKQANEMDPSTGMASFAQ